MAGTTSLPIAPTAITVTGTANGAVGIASVAGWVIGSKVALTDSSGTPPIIATICTIDISNQLLYLRAQNTPSQGWPQFEAAPGQNGPPPGLHNDSLNSTDMSAWTTGHSAKVAQISTFIYSTLVKKNPNPTGLTVSPSTHNVLAGGTTSYTATQSIYSPSNIITWSDGGAGGSFLPSSSITGLTVYTASASAGAVTITATPKKGTPGTAALTVVVNVVVTVSPSTAIIMAGGTVAYTASTSPSDPANVITWSDGAAGGSFSPTTGLSTTYTSSASAAAVTITATPIDGTPGTATLTVYYYLLANSGLSNSRATPAFQDTLGNGTQMLLLGPTVTRQEPNGFLNENAATNLFAYSQLVGTTTGSNWSIFTGNGLTVTLNSADVLAPDGTQTASKLAYTAITAAGGSFEMVRQTAATGAGTGSIWLRTLSGTYLINLCPPAGGAVQWTVTSTWQRFSAPMGGSGAFDLGMNGNTSGAVSIATGTVYAWGAQAETTAFATSYFPTNTNVLLLSGSVGNTAGGAWAIAESAGLTPTVTLNFAVAPDGTTTASKIVYPAVTANTGTYSLIGQNPTLPAPSTGSVWLRTVSGTATIYLSNNADPVAACAVTTTWTRFSMPVATANQWWWLGFDARGGTSRYIPTNSPGCTILAWGAQSEVGTQPSSFFQTGASITAVRAADVLTFANPLHGVNPTSWSFGATLTPASTWAHVNSSGGTVPLFVQFGTQIAANSMRGIVYATTAEMDVWDAAAAERTLTNTAVLSGSVVTSVVLFDKAGVLSMTPGTPGTPAGAGTGVITTQPTTITLGLGTNVFNFQGWYKTVWMNNV